MAIAQVVVPSLVANIILPVFATIAVVLRFYSRKKKGQPWKADDYTILVALVLSLGLAGSEIYSAAENVFVELWDGLEPYMRFRKLEFADILVAHVVYGLTKISAVLFYRRIFTVGRMRIATLILLVLISLFVVVAFFTVLFCSHNVSAFWTTPPELDGTQYNLIPGTLIIIYAVIDILLDLAVLITPLPTIHKLNLSLKKRIAIAGVFLLGSFCLVCSIIRLYYARILLEFRVQTRAAQTDTTLNNILWAHIECYASTIAVCLPTLPAIFQGRNFEGLKGSIRSVLSAMHLRSTSLLGSLSRREDDIKDQETVPLPDGRGWVKIKSKTNLAAQNNDHSEWQTELCMDRDLEMQQLANTREH